MMSSHDVLATNEGLDEELTGFIQSLLLVMPQEAAKKLNARLLTDESAGQAAFNYLIRRVEQVVDSLALPAPWRRALTEELKLARDYTIPEKYIPATLTTTPLLQALTSGEISRVFETLMSVPSGYVPMLAEQALQQHKADATDEWEGVRFIDILLHINSQGTRNVANQQALGEWGIEARVREDNDAQEQLLPERKQVVTEADRLRLEQRLAQLTEHWQSGSDAEVQAVIFLIEQRLLGLNEEVERMKSSLNESVNQLSGFNKIEPKTYTGRRVALLNIFNRQAPIRNDNKAGLLAKQYGLESREYLYKKYRQIYQLLNETGLSGRPLEALILDIKAIIAEVKEEYRQEAADKLNSLERSRL